MCAPVCARIHVHETANVYSKTENLQGVLNTAGTEPRWELLNYPYASCISYKKDLSPLSYGDQVLMRHCHQRVFVALLDRCTCLGGMPVLRKEYVCFGPSIGIHMKLAADPCLDVATYIDGCRCKDT